MQHQRFCRACLITELPGSPPTDWCPAAGPGLVPESLTGRSGGTGKSSPLSHIRNFTVKTDANQMAGVRSDDNCVCK